MQSKTVNRTTKYVVAVRLAMDALGHATNAQLLDELRQGYPDVSATTVHRVTARLFDMGEIGLAPTGHDGAMRFDANTTLHDHFMCTVCEKLRDASLPSSVRTGIEAEIGDGCKISGSMTVSGVCRHCKDNPVNKEV